VWTGIVVSVIWFNLFVGYFLYYRALGPNSYFIEATNACDSAAQAENDKAILIEPAEDRVAQRAAIKAKWKKCRDDINQPYRQSLSEIYKGIPFVAAAALGTVTFGWLVAWAGILIARRIRRRSS